MLRSDKSSVPGRILSAYREYGVVIDEASVTVNEPATNEHRRSVREAADAGDKRTAAGF